MNSDKVWNLLNELEQKINIERCWIDLLKEHCDIKDYFTDTSLGLIIYEIEECNKKVFKEVEKFFM